MQQISNSECRLHLEISSNGAWEDIMVTVFSLMGEIIIIHNITFTVINSHKMCNIVQNNYRFSFDLILF